MSLPETHKALVLSSFKEPIELKDVPTPSPAPGSAIVRVLSAYVHSNVKSITTGTRYHPFPPFPVTPGGPSVGRIVALGSDATTVTPGQLVFIDVSVRARDDPKVLILQGGLVVGEKEAKLDGEWHNGALAEYAKVPLENVYPLDEEQLLNRLGYKIHDLPYLGSLTIPYGGLADLELKPGETIVVAPGTGFFGSSTTNAALGLGARVIAAGRNEDQLKKMAEVYNKTYDGRFSFVKLTGDVQADAQAIRAASPGGKGADAYIDWAPSDEAAKSSHFETCIYAMKPYGRMCWMGGVFFEKVSVPYGQIVFKNLRLIGRFMYERKQLAELVGMVEAGLIKLGPQAGINSVAVYGLDRIQEAIDAAERDTGVGKGMVVLAP